MSDKVSIFLRYNLSDKFREQNFKGIMGNYLRGYEPVGLLLRSTYGALAFVQNRKMVRHISGTEEKNEAYQTF